MRQLIFVFGSNLKGIHGSGSARYAREVYGAQTGVGEGLTGSSYALPTCSAPGVPLSAAEVSKAVDRFIEHAASNQEKDYLLTAVGTGYAGFVPSTINFMLAARKKPLTDNIYIQARIAFPRT
jgi:hypothetical protein